MSPSRAVPIALGLLLAASALLNVVLFQRLNEPAPVPGPAGTAREARVETPVAPAADRSDQVLREISALRREVAELRGRPVESAPPDAPARPYAAPAPASGVAIDDPKVAQVLEEQERFRAFWRDLDRVFNARGKIDETQYSGTVIDATLDYLALADPARPRFSETALQTAADWGRMRREYDEARKALPPRDKENAVAYDAQRKQIDQRYKDQSKASVDRMKILLDLTQTRHAEFATHLDRWLRELAPRSTP